jgi:hypothetical protein
MTHTVKQRLVLCFALAILLILASLIALQFLKSRNYNNAPVKSMKTWQHALVPLGFSDKKGNAPELEPKFFTVQIYEHGLIPSSNEKRDLPFLIDSQLFNHSFFTDQPGLVVYLSPKKPDAVAKLVTASKGSDGSILQNIYTAFNTSYVSKGDTIFHSKKLCDRTALSQNKISLSPIILTDTETLDPNIKKTTFSPNKTHQIPVTNILIRDAFEKKLQRLTSQTNN